MYRVPRLGHESPLEDGAVRAARADEQLLVARGALVLGRVGVGLGEVLARDEPLDVGHVRAVASVDVEGATLDDRGVVEEQQGA